MSYTIFDYQFDSNDVSNGNLDDKSSSYDLEEVIHVSGVSDYSMWSSGGDNKFGDTNIYSYDFKNTSTRRTHFEYDTSIGSFYFDNFSNFSVSIFFKPVGSTMSKHESIMSFSDSNSVSTFQIGMANNGTKISVVCTASSGNFFEIGDYISNQWNHVVITIDKSTTPHELKTYLNGTITNTYNGSSSTSTTSKSFNIENIKLAVNRNETHHFSGKIHSIKGFNYVLDSTGVSALYTSNTECYHENTKILTIEGEIEIKNLKRGDLIKTKNGFKPLSKLIKTINTLGKFIRFPKNILGDNVPNDDLYITEGHPILFQGEYYNSENFLGQKNIEIIKNYSNYMYHLQFDSHEVIYSNNLTTTSLPHNTDYRSLYLKKHEYIDPEKYNEKNIGKLYPPYNLHESPLPNRRVKSLN